MSYRVQNEDGSWSDWSVPDFALETILFSPTQNAKRVGLIIWTDRSFTIRFPDATADAWVELNGKGFYLTVSGDGMRTICDMAASLSRDFNRMSHAKGVSDE